MRLLLPIMLSVCASACAPSDKLVKPDSDYPVSITTSSNRGNDKPVELKEKQAMEALLTDVADYAQMSALVYRYDMSPEQKETHGCDPYDEEQWKDSWKGTEGWVQLTPSILASLQANMGQPANPVSVCASGKGLAFQAFVKMSGDKPVMLAIAFRGTENNKEQWKLDWQANASGLAGPAKGKLNEEYRDAAMYSQALIAVFSKLLPPAATTSPVCAASNQKLATPVPQLPIILTGHSLGGGLAQHVAYRSQPCEIARTVTFDPSPVTNWTILQRNGTECESNENAPMCMKTTDPVILRVFMKGEILAYVRKVTTLFNTERKNREDWELAFTGLSHNIVKRHSMPTLANCITHWSNLPTSQSVACEDT